MRTRRRGGSAPERRDGAVLDDTFAKASKLLHGGHQHEAFVLFAMAAEQGHAHAQHNLALMLEQGIGATVDRASALSWYRRSWRRNPQPSTAENLAILYEELGNSRRARVWRLRAG